MSHKMLAPMPPCLLRHGRRDIICRRRLLYYAIALRFMLLCFALLDAALKSLVLLRLRVCSLRAATYFAISAMPRQQILTTPTIGLLCLRVTLCAMIYAVVVAFCCRHADAALIIIRDAYAITPPSAFWGAELPRCHFYAPVCSADTSDDA